MVPKAAKRAVVRWIAAAALLAVAIGWGALARLVEAGPARRSPVSYRSKSRVNYADSTRGPLKPVQKLQLSVSATAAYDSTDHLWTYSYSVHNTASSQNVLDAFAVRPLGRPIRVVSPPHWVAFYGFDGDSEAVAWSVKDVGPAPPGWNGLDSFVGPHHPRPGQTVSGFRILTRGAPVRMSFYAQGFDTLPAGGELEIPSPPTMFQEGVVGTTIGPGPGDSP